MADPQQRASSEDALRRHIAWRGLERCEAQIGGDSLHGILGGMRYDSQGRDFARAPSPQVRNDLGSRVARIHAALDDAPRLAFRELEQRFNQLDLRTIAPILTGMVRDIALYVGTGAVVGGGLGFIFGGGVGAIPGAALGAEAGTLALNLIGLASLVAELGKVIPEALQHYVEGFREAWGATPEPGQRNAAGNSGSYSGSATFGAHEIARGHILMLSGLLMGVMLWISKGGVGRSKLLAEIRANPRMGAPMARWVEASEGRFPAQLRTLAERETPAGGQGSLPKATPVRTKAPATTGSAAGTKPASPAAQPLNAGSDLHKATRWQEYVDNGGTWKYERWSNVYDANMTRASAANEAVDAYHQTLDWGQREVTVTSNVDGVDYARRLDIADVASQRGIEYKTGYQYGSADNLWEVARDQSLVENGWDIQWVFRDSASQPLLDALDQAGIRYSIGPP